MESPHLQEVILGAFSPCTLLRSAWVTEEKRLMGRSEEEEE